MMAAVNPLRVRLLLATAPSISCGDLPRISLMNWFSSAVTAALFLFRDFTSRERLAIGAGALFGAWPSGTAGAPGLAKRMPGSVPTVDCVPSSKRSDWLGRMQSESINAWISSSSSGPISFPFLSR